MVGSLGAIEALPLFPAMKPVEITDRPAVESCTHRLPSSADHNFTTIWIRNTDERTRLARLGTNLVVEDTDLAKNTVMTFLRDGDIANPDAEPRAHQQEHR